MIKNITRKIFLHYTAMAAAGAAGLSAVSCAHLSPRYTRPDKLTQPDEKLLLSNCSIIDVTAGKIRMENQILIQNGKIVKLLRKDAAEEITPDRTIDLEGACVTPGLINAHCHMTFPCTAAVSINLFYANNRQIERNAEECVKHGVTTVRDMLSMSGSFGELKDKIKTGEVTGPRILWCHVLDVDDGYVNAGGLLKNKNYINSVNKPNEAKKAVQIAADSGADFIKLFQQPVAMTLPGNPLPRMDLPTIRAIRDEAAGRGMGIAMHCVDVSGFDKGIAGDIATFEHMACDAPLNDEQIKKFLEIKASIIPTWSAGISLGFQTHGDKTWGTGDIQRIVNLRGELLPDMINEYLEPALVKSMLKQYRDYCNPDYFESWHLFPVVNVKFIAGKSETLAKNTKTIFEAGALMGCGNDGGIPFVFQGAIGLEMYFFELSGYKTADILKMATINNAKILGMEKEIGSIDEGKIADIAVFKKNPLETLRNTFNSDMVFQSGNLVYKKQSSGKSIAV